MQQVRFLHSRSGAGGPNLESSEFASFDSSSVAPPGMLISSLLEIEDAPLYLGVSLTNKDQYVNVATSFSWFDTLDVVDHYHREGLVCPSSISNVPGGAIFYQEWAALFGQAWGGALLEHGLISFNSDIANWIPTMQTTWDYLVQQIEYDPEYGE